jgi:predicted HTH domain antitoxin
VRPSHEAGGCPYAQGAAGSPAPGQSPGLPSVNTAALVSHLYDCQGLSTYEIAKAIGISRQRVGRLLHKAGVAVKPRGAGRQRQPRAEQAALTDLAVRLYLRSNLSSGQISALIGVPERTIRSRLRARGVRMRSRGRFNPLVRHALSRHGIASRPAGGPIWQRFPVPVDVGPELAKELYVSCGLGLRHIELISGQPGETVRALLRGQDITLRSPGGRSPFMRRWRGT